MRIAVLGATGRTGREVMRLGAERGHEMIPVVRRAGSGHDGERLADGRDAVALRAALRDAQAVIFAIGPVAATPDPTVMRESATAVLTALPPRARLVVITASGPIVAGDDPPTRYLAKLRDGAARGRVRSRRDGNVRWGFEIRRADLAAALLDALDDPTTVRAAVSYAS